MNRKSYQAEIHTAANAIGMSGAPAAEVAAHLRDIADRLEREESAEPAATEEASE